MNPAAITAKINKVATKYGPFELRKVYVRVVTSSGGNTLIDRGVTLSTADTLMSPQPILSKVGKNAAVLSTSSVVVMPDDYEFVFTPTQMTFAAVSDKSKILVLKDGSGNEEQLQLIGQHAIVLNGTEIGTRAIYRSVSR